MTEKRLPPMSPDSKLQLDRLATAYRRSVVGRMLIVLPVAGVMVIFGAQLGLLLPVAFLAVLLAVGSAVWMSAHLRAHQARLSHFVSVPQPYVPCTIHVGRVRTGRVEAVKVWTDEDPDASRPDIVLLLGSGQRIQRYDGEAVLWGEAASGALAVVEREGELLWPVGTAFGPIRARFLLGSEWTESGIHPRSDPG